MIALAFLYLVALCVGVKFGPDRTLKVGPASGAGAQLIAENIGGKRVEPVDSLVPADAKCQMLAPRVRLVRGKSASVLHVDFFGEPLDARLAPRLFHLGTLEMHNYDAQEARLKAAKRHPAGAIVDCFPEFASTIQEEDLVEFSVKPTETAHGGFSFSKFLLPITFWFF